MGVINFNNLWTSHVRSRLCRVSKLLCLAVGEPGSAVDELAAGVVEKHA